ncbi:MAG: DUF3943 domain-containing protein [Holophagaceae bacterium]|nr:DUF3943 domain-containing protein [Holophagaceae bacterium]
MRTVNSAAWLMNCGVHPKPAASRPGRNSANKFIKPIRLALQVLAALFVCGSASAQEGGISGSVKEGSNGIGLPGVIIAVQEYGSGALAGMGATDASGNYFVRVPSMGKYALVVSRLGYDNAAAPALIELSEISPHRTANFSMNRSAWPKGKRTKPVMSWETGSGKSYAIPAYEIPAFLILLNRVDRYAYPDLTEDGKNVYDTNFSTFKDHVFHGRWGADRDSFAMNQFNHPYHGTLYHGFARSAGLNYWESLVYDNAGSLLWETGGETTHPSINDQVASGIGGSFFGEVLFRMANLMLEDDRDGSKPGFWRKFGAAVLSPSAGFNRYAYGDRFKAPFPSNDPSIRWRLQLGESVKSDLNDQGATSTSNRNEATLDYSMDYGMPGKPGYSYDRPFDYFQFELTTLGNRSNPVDNIMIRGLLLGKEYEAGNSYQGIWGLYGGYDYISPYIFRVSSTSLSLGTTYQWSPSQSVSMQGSALGGFGYAAGGNISPEGERDYHYGIGPQVLLAFRLIVGDTAMFDLTGRTYYLNGKGGIDPGGREVIGRLNMGFTIRIYDRHALGIQYILSSRDARYPDRPDSHQKVGTIALVYNLLGHAGLGAIK